MASNPPYRERPGAATIVAALLLPPLGIYLLRGLSPAFWAGVVLTFAGVVPGIIFSLLVVLGLVRLPERRPPVAS